MIAQLSGALAHIADDRVIVDVNGVGYAVQVSRAVLNKGAKMGDAITLSIETQVREDAITLFGFASYEEQAWFRLLQTVQGVGAKAALSILAILPPETLSLAIAAQDKAAIQRADGVGPKLALRIVTELKDKSASPAFANLSVSGAAPTAANVGGSAAQDAISALANLGYGRTEAAAAVARAAQSLGGGAMLQDLITSGLKELAA